MKGEAVSLDSSYEKRQKQLASKLKRLAGSSTILRKVSRKENKEYDPDCEIARKIFWEALDEYEEGECDWGEMADEVAKSLKAIKKKAED